MQKQRNRQPTMKNKKLWKKYTRRVKKSPIKMSRRHNLTNKHFKKQENLANYKQALLSKGPEIRAPVIGDVNKLWSKSKHSLLKGNYSKATMFKLGALTILASLVSPYSVGQFDKGRVGDERTGIHALEDPNTFLKWHNKELNIKGRSTMSRKQRRNMRNKGEGKN